MTRLRPHKGRKVTDEQISALKAWMPFSHLARSLGISLNYAKKLRGGQRVHKTASP